jgi:hypothetical protein
MATSVSAHEFSKALLFAWIPMILVIAPLARNVFRSLTPNTATGLGALAGGISEGLVIFGLVALLACEGYAVVLLVRGFSGFRVALQVIAAISMLAAVTVTLSFTALFVRMWGRSGR